MKTAEEYVTNEDQLAIGYVDPRREADCVRWRREVLLRVIRMVQREAFDAGAIAMMKCIVDFAENEAEPEGRP
jgi:hypothetical protein